MKMMSLISGAVVIGATILCVIGIMQIHREREVSKMVAEKCRMTGEFGILTSGDSFVVYDCNEKGSE